MAQALEVNPTGALATIFLATFFLLAQMTSMEPCKYGCVVKDETSLLLPTQRIVQSIAEKEVKNRLAQAGSIIAKGSKHMCKVIHAIQAKEENTEVDESDLERWEFRHCSGA